LYNCTPVAVKATAGLRLLGTEKSSRILEAVRNHLGNKYPFQIIENDGVVIMDGVYAWITVNYLLNKIGLKKKSPTAAIFDLGGGSTQIVFEPGSLD
ncbi:12551_t:CDS:2, partial [Entrophospora sp. SA101]